MPITDSPFLSLTPDNRERPWLPVKIINHLTGKSISTYGLVDTGADESSLPADFARQFGHDLKKGEHKEVDTAGGKTEVCSLTTTIEILNLIAAMCVGSFPVAGTGILKCGKAATYSAGKRIDNLNVA